MEQSTMQPTKATLLGLPRELRTRIVQLVILTTSELPPVDASSVLEGSFMTAAQDPQPGTASQAPHTQLACKPYRLLRPAPGPHRLPPMFYKPAHNPGMSLLLINKQMQHEVTEAIISLATKTGIIGYQVDVVYIKNIGLFFTWLAAPVFSNNLGSVSATLRIFNPPQALKQSPNFSRIFQKDMWRRGAGGMSMGYWSFYHLLQSFLQGQMEMGPGPQQSKVTTIRPDNEEQEHSEDSSEEDLSSEDLSWEDRSELSYTDLAADLAAKDLAPVDKDTRSHCLTIRSLSINVLSAVESDILPLDAGGAPFNGPGLGACEIEVPSTVDCELSDQRKAALLFAEFLHSGLSMLNKIGDYRDIQFSRSLFQQVGDIEILVDGQLFRVLDLPKAFASLTWWDGRPVAYYDRKARIRAFQWKRRAEEVRRRAGFRMVEPSRQEYDGLVEE